jgi:hypothetical protein
MPEFKSVVVEYESWMEEPNIAEENVEQLEELVKAGWEIKTCTHFMDGNAEKFLVFLTKG